jgi:hypothetical protein
MFTYLLVFSEPRIHPSLNLNFLWMIWANLEHLLLKHLVSWITIRILIFTMILIKK